MQDLYLMRLHTTVYKSAGVPGRAMSMPDRWHRLSEPGWRFVVCSMIGPMSDGRSKNKIFAWLIAGAVLVAVAAIVMVIVRVDSEREGESADNETMTTPGQERRETVAVSMPGTEPVRCRPELGLCPDGSNCPASGVCCPAGDSSCQSSQAPPPPTVQCQRSGNQATSCPGGQACPQTLVCPAIEEDRTIPCVPGTQCASGLTCSQSGFCHTIVSDYVPCVPRVGVCPDGTWCPLTGVCP